MQSGEIESENGARSRFSYFGDEPSEGGVQAVRETQEARDARGHRVSRPTGAPAPDDRLLDISELARTVGMHYTHHFSFPPGVEGDLDAVAPIEGEVKLTNTGAALLLTGHVTTTLRMECGRCLTPTEQHLEMELEEPFDLISSSDTYNQEEVSAVDEDSPAAVIKGNILNLADLLRQNLLLSAPLQPLCREECPGILYKADSDAPEGSLLPTTTTIVDNPLRHLSELIEARRKQETPVSE